MPAAMRQGLLPVQHPADGKQQHAAASHERDGPVQLAGLGQGRAAIQHPVVRVARIGSLVLIRAAVQHPVIGVVGTRRGVLARFLGEIRSLRFVRVFRRGRLFRRSRFFRLGGLLGFRGFVRFLRLVGFFRHVRRGGGRQRAHLGQGVHIVEVRVLLHQRHRHQERVDLLVPGGSGALDDEIQAQRQP